MVDKKNIVLMRGGGDLASGVALRLHRIGINLVITELAQPLTVRRLVSLSNAVFEGQTDVEGVIGVHVENVTDALNVLAEDKIPVLVDPACEVRFASQLDVRALIDARMIKKPPELGLDAAPLVIGLGPGFVAGENCHAAIETNRGHCLGRVIWQGSPEADTGVPGKVSTFRAERVLRAPVDGIISANKALGEQVQEGELIAQVNGEPILAPFSGVLRGLLYDDIQVHQAMKVGDVDPRNDPSFACLVSEKSLAIAGGVLEALLSNPGYRQTLWN